MTLREAWRHSLLSSFHNRDSPRRRSVAVSKTPVTLNGRRRRSDHPLSLSSAWTVREFSAVEVNLVDRVRWVDVVVGVAPFDGVDREESSERGKVDAGAHLDGRDGVGVFVGALVLSEPAVVEGAGVDVGAGVVGGVGANLALGLRQGEVLGLGWSDVDLDTHTLRVRKNRPRPRYAHGCDGNCGKKPGWCPQRVQTNRDDADTKSRAGKRVIGLPDELVSLLKVHREEQDRERRQAGQLWHESGRVFTKPTGETLNPRTDFEQWKALLKRAGVRNARLHDARHTAATVLLVLGVPERTVMSIMGWSSTAMAARYQHVSDAIRREVATRVGSLIWTADEGDSEPE